MLFVVTHTPDRCPAVGGEAQARKFINSLSQKVAKKAGVKLLGSYIAPSEHTLFFIIEADRLSNIEQYTFNTLALTGSVRITPIMAVEETTKMARRILKK